MWRSTASAIISLILLALQPAWASVEELTWFDLVPPEAQHMIGMPEPMHAMTDLADMMEGEYGDPAVQMEPMAPVVEELHGMRIKLPGYVVPLGITPEGKVDEFLLVPYFGACIHVPPPPSNQIVYVQSSQAIALADLYQPFWISGEMQVDLMESELANAGYRISAADIEPYDY
ncbi:MAG: DUF3299 domain-containing protein [Pseudomonadaceae bacterium]|nr:MAG: DUF3299 domain-containing protein [Pseudomonadaceae bacterium]